MTPDSSKPLDGVDPESVAPSEVDRAEIRAALSSSNPLIRQRGTAVCDTFAEADVTAVRPFLDMVAALAGDDNAPVALRAISVLNTVARTDSAALNGQVSGPVDAAGSAIVDVQLTAAALLGKLVVERPDLIAPHTRQLVGSIRVTEPEFETQGFDELIDDEVTRRTLRDHDKAERKRRIAGRRTLINVIVAVTEKKPQSGFDSVNDLVTLLDDVDPAVVGGAIDALGYLAAANPDTVASVSGQLINCLDHDRSLVRARAVRALGRLGDDGAVSKLQTVAEYDEEKEIQEIAADTAEFLAGTP